MLPRPAPEFDSQNPHAGGKESSVLQVVLNLKCTSQQVYRYTYTERKEREGVGGMKRKKKSKYPSERPNHHLLGSISEMSQDSQPSPDT